MCREISISFPRVATSRISTVVCACNVASVGVVSSIVVALLVCRVPSMHGVVSRVYWTCKSIVLENCSMVLGSWNCSSIVPLTVAAMRKESVTNFN